jgi:hypothetical protein
MNEECRKLARMRAAGVLRFGPRLPTRWEPFGVSFCRDPISL